MNFELEKQNALTKQDKSHATKWDEKIKPLCNKINNGAKYFTTSSCAGRITIINSTNAKTPNAFLFKSHNQISQNQIKPIIKNLNNLAYFKMEACALHVSCKTLESAKDFLNKARNAGWKKSGIQLSKDKFNCELFSTEIISTPITKNISEDYLNLLVEEANKKLLRTQDKIKRLESSI